jgi:hypothetical protein
MPVAGPVEQVRIWSPAHVLRIPTAAGCAYFKAAPPSFSPEARRTRELPRFSPAMFTEVLAADEERGGLLTKEVRSPRLSQIRDDAARKGKRRNSAQPASGKRPPFFRDSPGSVTNAARNGRRRRASGSRASTLSGFGSKRKIRRERLDPLSAGCERSGFDAVCHGVESANPARGVRVALPFFHPNSPFTSNLADMIGVITFLPALFVEKR